MPILDIFCGYNKLLLNKDDQRNTAVVTPWKNFAYARMPFGLKNVGVTFKRVMDYVFKDIIGNFMEDYQECSTPFSGPKIYIILILR